MSEGNGHPYSWAAICNGYSSRHMDDCEFPLIPRYLAEQTWPDARIPAVKVTHIWTQDAKVSQRLARASLIENVVEEPEAMLGHINALLLARDDAENHLEFAAPFLAAGIPVYIDKPIALSLNGMDAIYKLQQYDGQIFTCSALRYASEMMLSKNDLQRIGPIRHLVASTPKNWEKYAVHIIEPSLKIVGASVNIDSAKSSVFADGGRSVLVRFENGITAEMIAFGQNIAAPLSIRVYGEQGWHDLVFRDSFSAFKLALIEFFEGIRTKSCRSPYGFNRQVVSIIESGLRK